jgi:hypothetical protein
MTYEKTKSYSIHGQMEYKTLRKEHFVLDPSKSVDLTKCRLQHNHS